MQIQHEVGRRAREYHAPKVLPATAVFPAGDAGTSGLTPQSFREVLTFSSGGTGLFCLRAGWSFPEKNHVWSQGPAATLSVPFEASSADILLIVTATPFVDETGVQSVTVLINRIAVAIWPMREYGRYGALVSLREKQDAAEIQIAFQIANPISPAAKGAGSDSRMLGLALHSVELKSL